MGKKIETTKKTAEAIVKIATIVGTVGGSCFNGIGQ